MVMQLKIINVRMATALHSVIGPFYYNTVILHVYMMSLPLRPIAIAVIQP